MHISGPSASEAPFPGVVGDGGVLPKIVDSVGFAS
jgi:hypothetical protein